MSEALEAPHQEVAEEVRQAPAKNVDETGWKQAGKKRWLWAAVTATAALFVIHTRRGVVGLRALLGEAITGVIVSDRWSAYHAVPLERRQVCWAHLRRDFQAMIDRGGEGAAVGEELLFHADMLFGLWHKVRDGTRRRRWLRRHLEWLRPEVASAAGAGRGLRLREDGGGVRRDPEGGGGVVDVRLGRGGRADQQRGGAGDQAGGGVAEEVVRLPQRGGVPVRRAPVECDADPATAGTAGPGIPRRGTPGSSPRLARPSTVADALSGYMSSWPY